jgi:hypothetical protein
MVFLTVGIGLVRRFTPSTHPKIASPLLAVEFRLVGEIPTSGLTTTSQPGWPFCPRFKRRPSISLAGHSREHPRAKSCEVVPAQPVDATPPGINFSSKGGVHDARETMEAFCGPAGRYVEPLESGAVLTCDWSSAGQGPCGHSASVGTSWGNRSSCSSPFAAGTDPGRARRHLPRNRQRLFDAGHRPTSESGLLHGKLRGSPPWRARAVSSQPSRSAGLGVGPAAQSMPAGHPQQAARDRCE